MKYFVVTVALILSFSTAEAASNLSGGKEGGVVNCDAHRRICECAGSPEACEGMGQKCRNGSMMCFPGRGFCTCDMALKKRAPAGAAPVERGKAILEQ